MLSQIVESNLSTSVEIECIASKCGLALVDSNTENNLASSSHNVKKRRGRPPKAKNTLEKENNIIYCICNNYDYGQMVLCDNNNCKIGWFHFGCVGLVQEPKGN